MTASPPKIKAFLATIKEQVLDGTQVTDSHVTFIHLLRMELLQRGILVPIESSDPCADAEVYDAIVSTAGKPLMESTLPPPLLAGASVIGARIAELCAKHTSSNLLQDVQQEAYKAAVNRFQSVPDPRFASLLQLASCPDEKETKSRLLLIAQGYYLRATSFQADAPPMWKKAWDVILERQSLLGTDAQDMPLEACVPLSNLIRLAASKGNVKRVSELTLRLTEAYLSTSASSSTSNERDKVTSQAFCDPYRLAMPDRQDLSQRSKLAKQALEACLPKEELEGTDIFLWTLLQLRVAVAVEDAAIEELAQATYLANKNRSGALSLETCRAKRRQEYLGDLGSVEDTTTILPCVGALRTALLEGSLPPSYHVHLAWDLMRQQVLRVRDRAQASALSKSKNTIGWNQIPELVDPLLEHIQTECSWERSMEKQVRLDRLYQWLQACSPPQRQCYSTGVTLLVSSFWMMASSSMTTTTTPLRLELIMDIISGLTQVLSAADPSVTSVVQTKAKHSDVEILRLKCARSTAFSLWTAATGTSLVQQPQPQQASNNRHVSHDAVAMYKKNAQRYANHQGELGMAWLQCLVAWSGIFQSPWAYCSITEARRLVQQAQEALKKAEADWGRMPSSLERIWIDLAHADAEGGILSGGFVNDAAKLYTKVLLQLETLELPTIVVSLLQSICFCGLARAAQLGIELNFSAEEYAQKSLKITLESDLVTDAPGIYIWTSSSTLSTCIRNHLSVSRQLVADSLLRAGRPEQAQSFLEAAVRDSPMDAEAAFALGAFRLRMALLSKVKSPDAIKAAQIQLLKAAKLDAGKANPFALLGVWFEEQGDLKRALGCYSKALGGDPPNPVAGRGILRLQSFDESKAFIDAAINTNSPLNGWAWRAVGSHKVMVDGQDDLAVVALLKALRCRDIEVPRNEALGIFYQLSGGSVISERAGALAELAMCYRRLGRFTAAIRAFHAAIEAAGESIASSVLCSCAQVELELGLFDEAAEKFNRVLDREDSSSHAIAAYGQGVALLSVAKRDTQDGKAGSAFANIKQAIDGFESSSKAFGCTRKLLGDLYSFGAGLPPDVFLDKNAEEKVSTEEMLKAQLSFICKGEDAYRSAVDCQIAPDEVELAILQASVISDIGANILLQAQLFSVLHNMGSGSDSDMNDCYDRASKEFRKSMDVNPMHAPAWCGLGCAVAANDPLLAQHAFCRCLELDKMFPDAYANVGFLYTSHESYNASESVMDALTQVADTPMMWMNRAFMLERGASKNLTLENGSEAHSNISRAADAYRAALQVMKHPSAMLGLSLTCRVAPTTESVKNEQALHLSRSLRRKESSAHMQEYLGTTCSSNHAVSLFAGVMVLEKGSENETAWSSTLIEEGKESIENVLVVKGLDATLDISAIRECIQSEQHVEKEKAKSSQPFDSSISLARQIVHEPNRADLWLSWAKELAQSKAPVPLALKSKSNRPLDPAMAAAKRASNMLTRQIVQPCMQGKLSASVDAQMASEALSLIFWLRQIEPEEIVVNTSDNEEPKEEEEKEEEQAPKDESPFDLQRSLLMCPNNKLARHALKLSS